MARILVIDDEPGIRRLVRTMLEQVEHEILEAENGATGLAIARALRPDIVLTDILMPDKEGIETIIEMRAEMPDIRIIAMSGGGRAKNLDFLGIAKKMGACTTLPKPFDLDELVKALATAGVPSALGSS